MRGHVVSCSPIVEAISEILKWPLRDTAGWIPSLYLQRMPAFAVLRPGEDLEVLYLHKESEFEIREWYAALE